jgi:hypothetical protein
LVEEGKADLDIFSSPMRIINIYHNNKIGLSK